MKEKKEKQKAARSKAKRAAKSPASPEASEDAPAADESTPESAGDGGKGQSPAGESKGLSAYDGGPTVLVGIAASAGGLEALRTFVGALNPTSGMAYVVAQHMSPQHRSMMVELLARETSVPVSEAQHAAPIRANHIYVGPPNSDVFVKDGLICLREPLSEIGPKPSADYLFASMAEAYGERAIAVVMSGTGTDGSHGVRAINAAGGICVAQSPESAKYDSMPAAAIKAGVDFVLPPQEIAQQLVEIAQRPRAKLSGRLAGLGRDASPLEALLHAIYDKSKIDFTEYKDSTIVRQIERRMAVHRLGDIESYLALTAEHPGELEILANSFMICVTSFFRDPEAFEVLRRAIKGLLKGKRPGDEIRIWVPGCATGEEAYTIAILIAEELGESVSRYAVHIFATDVNKDATEFARRGSYPETSIEHMDRKILERWFTPRDRLFLVDRKIREMVLFATHDLVQDPPFVRLDLVSCRNLLIYLKPGLQEKVFGIFSYALLEDGLLFLGKSETIGNSDQMFEVEDRKARLYRKRSGASSTLPLLSRSRVVHLAATSRQQREITSKSRGSDGAPETSATRLAQQVLFDTYVPPAVRVTPDGQVLEVFGDVDPFLKLRPGIVDYTVSSTAHTSVRTELKALIQKVSRSRDLTRTHPYTVTIEGQDKMVQAAVQPADVQGRSNDIVVSFETLRQGGKRVGVTGEETLEEVVEDRLHELEHELALTRESLQTVIEELETSNEELQSLNEEAQAANEELQASNEELQTANEELQATNEELTTVNDELSLRTMELTESNADLVNLENSQALATMVVGRDFRVRRYNEAMRSFFDIPNAKDVAIGEVSARFTYPHFHESIQRALLSNERSSWEFSHGADQDWFEMTVSPYRAGHGEGVTQAALVIRDVSARKLLAERVAESQKLEAIGMLTGGLAHDFNNLIALIVSNVELVRDLLGRDLRSDVARRIGIVLEAAMRGSEVTGSLLSIAGKRTLALRTVDLREVLTGSLSLLTSAAGRNVSLKTEIGAGPLVATLDVGAFNNVLLNLVLNARDAIGNADKGIMVLKLDVVEFADARRLSGGVVARGHYVRVTLTDSGKGMSPEVRERALDPFFTTKVRGVGTGLGLSMAKGFATQLGGGIQIDSTVGSGTSVSLFIPVNPEVLAAHREIESARLRKVHATGILKHRNLPALDRAVHQLARYCSMPMAQVCLRGEDGSPVTIASVGLQGARKRASCPITDHTLAGGTGFLEVEDAAEDQRFSGASMVCGPPGVRSFAAASLDVEGVEIGVLMVMGRSPRKLSRARQHVLLNMARVMSSCVVRNLDFSGLEEFSRDLAKVPTPGSSGDTEMSTVSDALAPEEQSATDEPAAAPQVPEAFRRLRVLVVDDEELLAEAASSLVESLGHQAVTAHSAEEALALIKVQPFDVLLSDIIMPGHLDGIALTREVASKYPEIRVILTSGYTNELNSANLPTKELLEKPYRSHELRALLGGT